MNDPGGDDRILPLCEHGHEGVVEANHIIATDEPNHLRTHAGEPEIKRAALWRTSQARRKGTRIGGSVGTRDRAGHRSNVAATRANRHRYTEPRQHSPPGPKTSPRTEEFAFP